MSWLMWIVITAAVLFIGWFLYAYKRETGWEGLKEFETDDCSGGMSWIYKKLTGKRVPWADECVYHDLAYHEGGTAAERLFADKELMRGVADTGNRFWGIAMFLAVRPGGVWWLPTSYRWGYGYAYQLPWNIRTPDSDVKRVERSWKEFFKDFIFGKTVWETDNEGVMHYIRAEYYKYPYWPECFCNLVKSHESGHLAGIKGSWKVLDIMWEAPGKLADTTWEKLLLIIVGPCVLIRFIMTGSWFSAKNLERLKAKV